MTKAIPAITPKERKAVTKMLNKYSMVWRTPTDYFKKYEAALSAAEARIERLEKALKRLGDMEAFTVSRVITAHPGDKELIARVDFARAALEGETK